MAGMRSSPSARAATFFLAFACTLSVAQAPAQSPKTCPVVQTAETDTEAYRALGRRDFPAANTLFRAQLTAATTDAARAASTAGLIRTQLATGKLSEALADAKKSVAEHPNDALLQDVLGEVYFRRGETDEAANAFNTSIKLDFCSSRTHFDMAHYLRLSGMFASEKANLNLAHILSPHDITFAPAATPHTRMSAEDRLAEMMQRLESTDLTPEDRASLQRAIEVVRAQSKGSCQVVHPVESTRIPMVPISKGPYDMYGAGLELQINGHKKRFEIDTGASGLLISRSAAASAGIIGEAEIKGGGLGDGGPTKELLAHVDSLRVGELEFHNCLVRVFDKRSVLPVDGLIGPDVFSSWIVTLDIPSREVRLSPLPKRPSDVAPTPSDLDTAGEGENAQVVPRDRYIAPEMQNWTPVFRYGHSLIFLTRIGKAPPKLFIMDTGSSRTIVSASAAKEVTGVSESDNRIRGINGDVKKVSAADDITISFARVTQRLGETAAIDTSNMGRGSGVEISGLIGFPTLRELIISIDYRDNLVNIVYDPKQGFHAH